MKGKRKEKKMVLVIEDERPLLAIIQEKLEKEGMRVLTSRSVSQAFSPDIERNAAGRISMSSVELALNHLEDLGNIDAIWLDHNLLGSENGLDFVVKLKANGGHWKKIPIFVVSNTADPALVKKYAKIKVLNYYIKAEHTLESIVSDIKKTVHSR